MPALEWMAWTWPTAVFFLTILALVATVSLVQMRHPRPARRGLLPLATTPGDRLFIALLGAAFVHVAWLLLAAATVPVWPATVLAGALGLAILRYG